jgi:glycolate oxidase FAD binding subunit
VSDCIALWKQQVTAVAHESSGMVIGAGGTKHFYGRPIDGTMLDARAHAGVESYEPSELVITARCGTPLAEIEALLATQNQMLAFEPPHFGPGATLGGCIATGLSGPRRYSAGSARDFVLGARLLDGRGRLHKFGGVVMKNVAGYDVARLLAGSLGTLGVIVGVSLKVLPRPQREATLALELDKAAALARFTTWAQQPLPVSATCWHAGVLHVRLSGADVSVEHARTMIGGELVEPVVGDQFWMALREQSLAFFAGDEPLWRVAVPSDAAQMDLGPAVLLEWSGSLRWLRSQLPSQTVRDRARALGGHATLFRADAQRRATEGVFTPLAPGIARIHERLKSEFDPNGVFNRGRMYANL